MPGPIAIMSALPAELAALREVTRGSQEVELAPGIGATRGQLEGSDVVLVEAGIGKVAMAIVATALMLGVKPRLAIFTGVAGGLDPELRIGDVVIADRLIQHDFGLQQPDGLAVYQPGHLPFLNPTDLLGFQTDASILAATLGQTAELDLVPVEGRAPRVVAGTVVTGDQFVNAPQVRHELRERFGAVAVEMEGAAMAQVCEVFDVPFLVIRALSDLAGEQAPSPEVFTRFVDAASANSARVVRRLLAVVAATPGD